MVSDCYPTPTREHYLLTPCTVNSELPSTSRERVNSVQAEVLCTGILQQQSGAACNEWVIAYNLYRLKGAASHMYLQSSSQFLPVFII